MSVSWHTIWTQYFPPRNSAPVTEATLPSQAGKVFIVTGGSSGIGYELSRILYGAGGKVYMLTRSKDNADEAIRRIKTHYKARDAGGGQKGDLIYLPIDLTDLETVRVAARDFISLEGPDGRLDILFNNAGTGGRKDAPLTRQGLEYHFGTNCVGAFLLTRLLGPLLSKTAERSTPGAVRVIWAASILVEMMSPKHGIPPEFLQDSSSFKNQNELYSSSKVGNWFLASEFARRQPLSNASVLHIAGNPGNYPTNIWRHTPAWIYYPVLPLMRTPVHGAETWMWMAFSESITLEDASLGRYAICDGRWHPGQRGDIVAGLLGVEEGGTGLARKFYSWCKDRVTEFEN